MNPPNWQSLLAAFLSPTSLTLLVIGGLVVIVANTFLMRWMLKQLRSEPGDDAELAGNTGVSNAIANSSTRASTVDVPRKSSLRPRESAGERAATSVENADAVPAVAKAPVEVPVRALVEIEPARPVKLTSFEPLIPFTPAAMPEGGMVASNEPAVTMTPAPVAPLAVADVPVMIVPPAMVAKPVEPRLPELVAPSKDPAPARELPVTDALAPSLVPMIADPVHAVGAAPAPGSATTPPLAVTVPQEKAVAPVPEPTLPVAPISLEPSPMHVATASAASSTLPPDGALVMPAIPTIPLVETTTTSAEKLVESIDVGLLKSATPPAPPETKPEEPVKTAGCPRVFLPTNIDIEVVPEEAVPTASGEAPEMIPPVALVPVVPEHVADITPEVPTRVFLPAAVVEPPENLCG